MESGKSRKLEKLEGNSSSTAAERLVKNLMGQEKTKKAAPKIVPVGQSGLLDRVKQFLPQMQEANHRLMDIQHPEELDIEKLSKQHKNNYIEINLACADLEDERLAVLNKLVGQDEVSSLSELSSSSEDEEESKPCKSKEMPKKSLITELP